MTWYEEEVKDLESRGVQSDHKACMVFYGSSSIRMWESLQDDFPEFNPVNLGFGGSTLEACAWYFDRLVAPYKPGCIIIYAGDNDLGDGKQPEAVLEYFRQLIRKIKERFGELPFAYISIKPSLSRLDIIDQISFANRLIEEEIASKHEEGCFINIFDNMLDDQKKPRQDLYLPDGLHINNQGYALWKQIIRADRFMQSCRC